MKKLPPGTTLVLPAADLVLEIFDKLQEYSKKPGQIMIAHALTIKPIVEDSAVCGINRVSIADLVAAMYLDLLNSNAKWNLHQGEEHHFNQQWIKMIQGRTEQTFPVGMKNELYVQVFRRMFDQIDERLQEYMDTDPSWNVWYARRHGLDVMIEKGPDFRILDWERRMLLGSEYQKLKDENEPIPSNAWLPDSDARRFAELLSTQQTRPSMLGQSTIDAYDAQRAKEQKSRMPAHRRRGKRAL
jgi:hypothetical protein